MTADTPKAPIVLGRDVQDQLNRAQPIFKHVGLGDILNDLITQLNAVTAKYNALLAHVDTANVAGIGNTNVATYGVSGPAALTALSKRTK